MPSHRKIVRASGERPAEHGGFKHTAKPATLETVLDAFGLKKSDYERTKAFVRKRVSKEPAHAS